MVSKQSDSELNKEAIAILDAESERRIHDIQQRVEFICAALRAQGNMQINELNLAIRQLTMREFCHVHGADAVAVFQKQAKERLQQTKKRTRDEMEKDDEETAQVLKPQQQEQQIKEAPRSPIIKRTKRILQRRPEATKRVRVAETKPIELPPVAQNTNSGTSNQTQADADQDEQCGPMFVHLERSDHPRIAFKLDPQRSVDELGQYVVNMPDEVFERLNQTQRDRLHCQIEHIQSQLEKVKEQLKPA